MLGEFTRKAKTYFLNEEGEEKQMIRDPMNVSYPLALYRPEINF